MFKAVVMTEYNYKSHVEVNKTNEFCRNENIPFILSHVSGCTARVLNDFGSNFKVLE